MNPIEIIIQVSVWIFMAAIALTLLHLSQQRALLDKVNALNLLGNLVVGLLLVFGFIFKKHLFFEISLLFCLVSFLPILAITHHLLKRTEP